ncbi:PEP-CTERM sorting domain-containing protein [Aphanothece hegewaldii]|nr:PEP-CTERM sorting domain-containing protein [Aphanothece hegewaldii]
MQNNLINNKIAILFSAVIGLGFTTSPTMAASVIGIDGFIDVNSEYIFGFSGASTNSLTLELSDNTTITLFTDQSEFTSGIRNQGWWSATESNDDINDNYIVGDISNDQTSLLNNFFSFDISSLSGTVTSATLNLQRYFGQSDLGQQTQTYSLYDVSTDAAILNNNMGTSGAIFNDLGSGKNYGNYNVTVAGDDDEIIAFSLNSNAISDLNNAILANSNFFSIGGTLFPSNVPSVPEPASIFGILTVAGLGLIIKRKNRNIVD